MKRLSLPLRTASITKIALLSVALTAFVALTARPSTAAVTTNSFTPFSMTVVNPCNGDTVVSTGVLHVVASTTFDGAGFQTTFNTNEQRTKDTDITTGDVCTDHSNFNNHGLNVDVVSGAIGELPQVLTVTFTGNVNCPGQAGSFSFKIRSHTTINPNGIVTVSFTNFPPGT
jgi:hypothetical protein